MSSFKGYPISADTNPEAEELLFKLLAKKSAAEKIAMACELTAAMRALAMSGLRERHPEATESQLKVKLAEQLYGRDIAEKIAERLGGKLCHE